MQARFIRGSAVLALVLMGVVATQAVASPAINSAIIQTRIFNDDPLSTLVDIDSYPTSISISDTRSPGESGFANFHRWAGSTDDSFPTEFQNGEGFKLEADLTISGTGHGEAGLQVPPWWDPSKADGFFNFRTTDGEIACFGGRLPFYSFSAAPHFLHYTKGDTVRAGIIYRPNSLTAGDPGTIEYTLTMGGNDYTSGVIPFSEGNAAEGHGTWGLLNTFQIGGHMKLFIDGSPPDGGVTTTWENITYVPEPASMMLLGLGALALLRRR